MRLISCRLQNTRRHRTLELTFGRQITLIAGANESGKSTLVEALHKGLFLRATATGRAVEALRSRVHPGLPEVEIHFEAAGDRWRLRKRFAGASGTCQLSNNNGLALNGAAAEEQLAALLGFEGPVEGRRMAQLPARWAHLWVRQGEAGMNPFSGGQAHYDHNRLVEQLQQGNTGDALQSELDHKVLERIRAQVAELYTATGRVKAGSALATAQLHSREAEAELAVAQQRLTDLNEAMEQLRRIGERMHALENEVRPCLQRERDLARQLHLLNLTLIPQLEQAREQAQLQEEQQQQLQQQQRLQRSIETLQRKQQPLQQQREQLLKQQQHTAVAQQQLAVAQELLQLQLDLKRLESEAEQLHSHRLQLQQLQAEAEKLKQQRAALPPIQPEQVKELRRAEQAVMQANTRIESMAASLVVQRSDRPVRLNGHELSVGEQHPIHDQARLEIGDTVVLEWSPGGGEALPNALAQQKQCLQQLQRWQQQLGVPSSDDAEAIERERQLLEAGLSNLRQSARAIPWSGLEERLAAIAPRRQQLKQAIANHTLSERQLQLDATDLQNQLDRSRQQSHDLNNQHQQQTRQATLVEEELERSKQSLSEQQAQLAQLEGALAVRQQRLDNLQQRAINSEGLAEQQQQQQQLQRDLSKHRQQRQASGWHRELDAESALSALEQEREQLLQQKGQCEQRCNSLGSSNPSAECEQRQAVCDLAQAELQAQQQRGEALRLLLDHFHRAQTNLAARYSEPLKAAITPYLRCLGDGDNKPLLAFDPQAGFHALQMQQAGEAFGFEQLSGGMREQMAAAVRLAMAVVLKPAYNNALPVVFDDAFTNSDRQRLQGLQEMLQLGLDQGLQIVLLTCHGEDYAQLATAQTKKPSASDGGPDVMQVNLS